MFSIANIAKKNKNTKNSEEKPKTNDLTSFPHQSIRINHESDSYLCFVTKIHIVAYIL